MDQKKNKEVMTIIVSVLVIILAAYLFISPTAASLRKSNLTVAVKGQDLKRAQENLDNLKSLELSLNSQSDLVKSLSGALPTTPDEEDLTAAIEAIASKDGLKFSGITPTETGESSESASPSQGISLASADFDLNLSGSYEGLKNFLIDLENNRRPVNVSKVSITKDSSAEGVSTLNITLSISAFYTNLI